MSSLRQLLAGLVLFATALPALAKAQTLVEDGVLTRKEAAPTRLVGIDIEEHLDSALPLDLEFTDSLGKSVTLATYVSGKRPVIFTLNYSNCPMLCSLQLSGFVTALGKLDRSLGEEYEVVTISLDPNETPQQAAETRTRYLGDYASARGAEASAKQVSDSAAGAGWHFLTGTKRSIDSIAAALGISYAYNEARREYVHPASAVVATPDGRIARYLYGIEYHPKTLSLSLVEAAEGKIGSSVDRLILYCFHYDETEGRYAPVAMNIMRVGGGVTALSLGAFLGAYWLRYARRRGAAPLVDGDAGASSSKGVRS